jgi:hypothetical protein
MFGVEKFETGSIAERLKLKGETTTEAQDNLRGGDQGRCHQPALHTLRSFPDQYSTTSIKACKKKILTHFDNMLSLMTTQVINTIANVVPYGGC